MSNEDAMIEAFAAAGIRMDSRAVYTIDEVAMLTKSKTNKSKGRISIAAAAALMDPPVSQSMAWRLEKSALTKLAKGLSDLKGVEVTP